MAITRPIIFVAHCLGGIVVKSALALAYHGDGTHAMTWVFTYGIVFLGVPHRGIKLTTWGKVTANILRQYTGTQNIWFLNTIERGSADNEALYERFRPLLNAYIFVSVCETIPDPSHDAVVSREALSCFAVIA